MVRLFATYYFIQNHAEAATKKVHKCFRVFWLPQKSVHYQGKEQNLQKKFRQARNTLQMQTAL